MTPTLSEAEAEIVTVPETVAPSAGLVTLTVGGVVSDGGGACMLQSNDMLSLRLGVLKLKVVATVGETWMPTVACTPKSHLESAKSTSR